MNLFAREPWNFSWSTVTCGACQAAGAEALDGARRPGQRANSDVTGLKYACICEEGREIELSNQRQYAKNGKANALTGRHHEIKLDDDPKIPNINTSLRECLAARQFLEIVQQKKGENPSNQQKLKHFCLAASMIRNQTFLH